MEQTSKILLLGASGMLGSAILQQLEVKHYTNVLAPKSGVLNLIDQNLVAEYFAKEKPEYIIFCAAKVGGIAANIAYKADFIYQNLMMECNVIHNAHLNGVKKVVFVSSGCVYPRDATNPITEDAILTGKLEPSNEHYAMAKIAGIKICESYYSQYGLNYCVIIPNNIYGPKDNYHPQNSHVMAALIRKFHEAKINNAKSVEVWGSGNQKREFIYVTDVASACILGITKKDMIGNFNAGSGLNISIKDVALKIKNITGFNGDIIYDTTKPEGHSSKMFDTSKLQSQGWTSKIDIDSGIKLAYSDFLLRISSQ